MERHKLRTALLTDSALQVSFGDGRTQRITHVLPRAHLKLGGELKLNLKLVVADIAEEIVLGKDWLHKVNPRIDWAADCLYVTRNSKDAPREVCIPSVATASSGEATGEKPPGYVVSRMQIKRMLRKPSTTAYLVYIKQQRGKTATLDNINGSEAGEPEEAPEPATASPPSKPPVDPRIQAVLDKYEDVFQKPTGQPPDRGDGGFRIHTEPGKAPPFKPAYRMNTKELEELRQQIEELLSKGWIRPSQSMYGAPVIFVRKASGELRMCIDYRALNQQTVRDRYPLPRVDELLDQLGGSKKKKKPLPPVNRRLVKERGEHV